MKSKREAFSEWCMTLSAGCLLMGFFQEPSQKIFGDFAESASFVLGSFLLLVGLWQLPGISKEGKVDVYLCNFDNGSGPLCRRVLQVLGIVRRYQLKQIAMALLLLAAAIVISQRYM